MALSKFSGISAVFAICTAVWIVSCSDRSKPDDPIGKSASAIQPPSLSYSERLGVFADGGWALDDGDGVWEGCGQGLDRCLSFGGVGDVALSGNFTGAGPYDSIGVYRSSNNTFYLDWNSDGIFQDCAFDRCISNFVSGSGNQPVIGRWTTSPARDRLGIFRNGQWWLDADGDHVWTSTADLSGTFGATGDRPVAGKWFTSTSDIDLIGVFNAGQWKIDNGNRVNNGCTTDPCFTFGGAGDDPVDGTWFSSSGSALDQVGKFNTAGAVWNIDRNGDRMFSNCTTDDCTTQFGGAGQKAVVGKWPPARLALDGDFTLASGGDYWENVSAVVPPGHGSCPGGRAFVAGGGASGMPHVLKMDLTCQFGACTLGPKTDIWNALKPQMTTQEYVSGADWQMAVHAGHVFVLTQGVSVHAGHIVGTDFVWRSTDCGQTWEIVKRLYADDPAVLEGRCGLPQGYTWPAAYRPSTRQFLLDWNENGTWDGTAGGDVLYSNFGDAQASDLPVLGVWDPAACLGSAPLGPNNMHACGKSRIGTFRNGAWKLDVNGNGVFDGCAAGQPDQCGQFGQAGDIPIVGKWNAPNDHRDLIGVYRPSSGEFFLDTSGDRAWQATDAFGSFGTSNDRPVAGIWTPGAIGSRPHTVGTFRAVDRDWFLDNGNIGWNGCSTDKCIFDYGTTSALPVAGNWGGQGIFSQGFVTNGQTWTVDRNANGILDVADVVDANGNGVVDTGEKTWTFGSVGDLPLVGRFAGNHFGGWDRPELRIDPTNGAIVITTSCDYTGAKEVAVLRSNTVSPTSWSAKSLWGAAVRKTMPNTMTSVGGTKLYVFGIDWGAPPEPWPDNAVLVRADMTGTLLSEHVISTEACDPVPDGVGGPKNDGSTGIAYMQTAGQEDRLYVTYPVAVTTNPPRMEVDIRRVRVNGASVTTESVTTLRASSATGSVTQATIVEGAPGTNTALVYWKETTTSSAGANGTITMKAVAISGDRITAPIVISTSGGLPRSWNNGSNALLTGDYVKGAAFVQAGISSFLVQWTETPSGASRQLHAAILRVLD